MNKGRFFSQVRPAGISIPLVLLLVALVMVLACAPAMAIQRWTWERFGFNTWAEGWKPFTNGSIQAVTNVYSTTNNVPDSFVNGAYCLEVDLDLRTNPAAKSMGRVYVDMKDFFPYAAEVPMNLSNADIYAAFRWPSTTLAAGSNRYRLFVADSSSRYEYFDWFNVGTNGSWIEGNWWKVTATNTGAEPGFDPCKVQLMGFDFATGPSSTGVYQGPIHIESIRFDIPPGAYTSPPNQRYSFGSDAEGWTHQTYAGLMACTNVSWVSSAPSNSAGCLAVDMHLDGADPDYNEGEIMVDMRYYPPDLVSIPVDLKGKRVSAWIYCPAGLDAPESGPNYVRLFCKDETWKSFYGSLQHIRTNGNWFSISMTPDTNMPRYGWIDAGFDPTRVHMIGLQIAAAGGATSKYDGKFYVDGVAFETDADTVNTNNLRYDFEPNSQGWEKETYVGPPAITGIVAVSQSTNYAVHGTNSLKMDVNIQCVPYTNRQAGAAKVDMRWYPPPVVRAPFDLENKVVNAYIYCPAGSASTNASWPNQVRLYVNDTNWNAQYGTFIHMKDGQWVKCSLTVTTNSGFLASQVIGIGVDISMVGTYNGPLYLDAVEFPASPPPALTNSEHVYDFEAGCQAEWWKWDTNPDGWNALAWTNTYYATNYGTAASVALAASAVFVTNTTDPYRKGVFEIEYQPALNLTTKDHRKIQAKLRFEPPTDTILSFDAAINVYDKISDNWYFKQFKVGASDWNILEFDLADAGDYADTSPPGPMDVSSIGFVTIQVYANVSWTGTVYLEDVVVGGRETQTNFNKIGGAFARAAGNKFTIGGTNFYHCGANIEYMFSVSDGVCEELLDLAKTCHVQAVRTWAFHEGKPYSFQPEQGVWNTLAFEHLDRIVAMAQHRGIRLMLGLVDNWAHNGGMFQYMKWVQEKHPDSVDTNLDVEGVLFHDQFWTNAWAQQWYKDFVVRLLNRTNSVTGVIYKDDPGIFAWEIVNEPRCESDYSGAKIHRWLWTNSDWVATIDTNHILGGGEEGGYVNTYDFADTVPWEVYPDNYYHYGVHGVGGMECDLYGCGRGHGVDFISDLKSASTFVSWQGGTWTNQGSTNGEWRAGVSNLDFCTSRIYVDQKEYNLWRTNLNSCDQRIEWINHHWWDAHEQIQKPMILEEFGIHAIGWVYNGFYGQLQYPRSPEYSPQDRADIYDLFYHHIEQSGIPGSFFWNFGYEGMWEDPFYLCEEVGPWYADAGTAATGVTLSTEHVIQATNCLRLGYDVLNPATNTALFVCPTNEMWVLKVIGAGTNRMAHGVNRVKFLWNIYNPTNPASVALRIKGCTNWITCQSVAQAVTTGWNKITFDLSASDWKTEKDGWVNNWYLISVTNDTGTNVLEDLRQVALSFQGLSNGPGAFFIDDIQIKRDDGFVIYADDPVIPVIRAHADRMGARNVATNGANNPPVASNITIVANAFRATNVTLMASDADPADTNLSYRIITKPTNGWVFGTPPNLVYKSEPGTTEGDLFTYKAHDGKQDSAEAVVTVSIGSTDTDNDSLPDVWEFGYFPKRVQFWPYDSDSLTNLFNAWDWDGDLFTDWEEYRAGTSPKDAGSYLWVGGQKQSLSQFVINWPGVSGKHYDLQRSTNLVAVEAGFTTHVATNIAAVVPTTGYTDAPPATAGPILYRIRVE